MCNKLRLLVKKGTVSINQKAHNLLIWMCDIRLEADTVAEDTSGF